MIVGVPKEVKNNEYRVGMVPASVVDLTTNAHQVLVEAEAGVGSGYTNDDYLNAGATVVDSADEVFARADMIVKVKEPQPEERHKLREGQIIFTYLHLAPDKAQTADLIQSKAVCIAYETITSPSGVLPLLVPMSEVAGRLSVQAGSHCLEKTSGGSGVLLSGVAGTGQGKVVIIGAGIVGTNAAMIATGLGARVILLDNNVEALRRAETRFGNSLETVYSNTANLERQLLDADLVIGGVLIPGSIAPKLVTKEMVNNMVDGSVIVDVAIDQGGCVATSRPTTHSKPTFVHNGVLHYCVPNVPSLVSRTASKALNNVTQPYILRLAKLGYKRALIEDQHFANGLNVHRGAVTLRALADAQDLPYTEVEDVLSGWN